jgi:hypothetical protein
MAQHGYLREYDEAPDRGEDRDRWRGEDRNRWRDEDRDRWRAEDRHRWRDEDRERRQRGSAGEWNRAESWRSEQRDRNERNLNFMLGDRDRSWDRGRDSDREGDFFRGTGNRSRSSSRQQERQYRGANESDWDQPYSSRYENEGRSIGGDWERSPRRFSSQQDDHYRSWRNRQLEALDRDYQDYCREREQQFHRDFDDWRQNRQKSQGSTNDELLLEEERERTHNRAMAGEGNTPSPVGDATLGTNNSENTGTGRAKPSV